LYLFLIKDFLNFINKLITQKVFYKWLFRIFIVIQIYFLAINVSYSQTQGCEFYYTNPTEDTIEIHLIKYYNCTFSDIKANEQCVIYEANSNIFTSILELELKKVYDTNVTFSMFCENGRTSCIKKVTYSSKFFNRSLPGGFKAYYMLDELPVNLTNISQNYKSNIVIMSLNIIENFNNNINSQGNCLVAPLFKLCKGQKYKYFVSAVSPDNDSTSFYLSKIYTINSEDIQKYDTINHTNNSSIIRPPLEEIQFNKPYSSFNPFGSGIPPLLNIDQSFDFVSTKTGEFLMGLTISEFRKGKLISEHQIVFITKVIE